MCYCSVSNVLSVLVIVKESQFLCWPSELSERILLPCNVSPWAINRLHEHDKEYGEAASLYTKYLAMANTTGVS